MVLQEYRQRQQTQHIVQEVKAILSKALLKLSLKIYRRYKKQKAKVNVSILCNGNVKASR